MTSTLRAALLGGLAIGLSAPAWAQTAPQTGDPARPSAPTTNAPLMNDRPGVTSDRPGAAADRGGMAADRREGADRSNIVAANELEAGANSFTEGQVRSRLEEAGFTAVENLRKDDDGFWRGRATRGGSQTDVAMDFRGRIAAGNLAQLGGNRNRSAGDNATGGNARNDNAGTRTGNTPDGSPGNPPSTVTGRAADAVQGQPSRPDGTPDNPPGTAAGRALDRATGSNTTGANPGGASGPTGGGANNTGSGTTPSR